ncbi:hypothetical protein J2Z40_002920 [Cytobacillus eiseniae]|uniref:AlgX/AlgJ SGNH hydrolase-like domain-containing protein n=1 Tax=Cytobacillus eiseniae TaxID=762947 RepID=A0ABS4RHI8_9BACI|nr:hypothetical protein [Cytobacillus eiseniae]MBP2242346.1 hypothetical protein [Cytobacillus eiseniae]
MKIFKVYNLITIIIFLGVIFIPLFTVNTTSGRISTTENRALASFPSFKMGDNRFNAKFIQEFEKWFNDNMGLRDQLVKFNTIMQYKLFGQLTKKDVIIGKDNWVFYVTDDIIKDFQNLNTPSDQQLLSWGNSLERVDNYLKERKIPFIMMLNPDKKTIYPEKYPATIIKNDRVSKTDILTNYLNKNTDIDFFTPIDALLQAKDKATVYSPRFDNAHWNSYGALIGYQELMNKVKGYFPNIKMLSWDDFQIDKYKRTEKVYNAVSFAETDYGFVLKNRRSAINMDGYFQNLNLVNNNVSYRYENEDKTLPKALVFGDSYFYGFLIPDLAESFSEFTFIHSDNIDKIENFVGIYNPDIVIFENVERMLDHSMEILGNSKESFVDYKNYVNLPTINNPTMWVDYSDNILVQHQGTIKINNTSKVVNINGWAIDSEGNNIAGDIYLKVGNKYYSGSYGLPRISVAEVLKNPSLTNSGFSFNISTSELKKERKVSFIIIANDKTYQYAPIEYKVEVN